MRLPAIIVCILALVAAPAAGISATQTDDDDFFKTVQDTLRGGQYELLDRMADDLRTSDEREVGGQSRLRYFYGVILSGEGCCETKFYVDRANQFAEWLRLRPDSLAARLAGASAWITVAWRARGTEFASKTPPAAWDLMRRHLDVAATYLDGVGVADDPYVATVMLDYLQLGGGSRSEMDAIFAEAIEKFPTQYSLYADYAILLQPKWYGRTGELKAFINTLPSAFDDDAGRIAYTYVASRFARLFSRNDFFANGFAWPELKADFALREARYGLTFRQWNTLLFLAIAVPDVEFAQTALAHVEAGPFYAPVWGTPDIYQSNVDWLRERIDGQHDVAGPAH